MKKLVCEFTGTLMLTLIACGVAVMTNVNYVGTALAFGLVIIAMAYSIGNISGCHINPAVSFGMALSGRMKWNECIKYIVAQILGAIAGSALLGVILEGFTSLGANSYTNAWIALLVEIILTFIFILTILCITEKKENSHIAGIVIALTLTLVHLFGLPITGTSVNPARSIGPALLQGNEALSQLWVFILAPMIGAALAALFYRYIIKKGA